MLILPIYPGTGQRNPVRYLSNYVLVIKQSDCKMTFKISYLPRQAYINGISVFYGSSSYNVLSWENEDRSKLRNNFLADYENRLAYRVKKCSRVD